MNNVRRSTMLMVKLALLSAAAVIFMYFDFPVLPAFPWLKIDLSDIPALVGAFAFGPLAGIVVEAMKNVLIFFVKGTQTAGIGELANFLIGATFVGCAGVIYVRNKTRKMAVISMLVAMVFMSIVGVLANYFLLMPLYGMDKMPAGDLINYIVAGVVPFNLIKGLLVSAITLLIYKRISILIHGAAMENGKRQEKKIA